MLISLPLNPCNACRQCSDCPQVLATTCGIYNLDTFDYNVSVFVEQSICIVSRVAQLASVMHEELMVLPFFLKTVTSLRWHSNLVHEFWCNLETDAAKISLLQPLSPH